jgi:hypothetical protein
MEGKLSFSLFPWIRIEKDFSEFSVYILGDMTRSIGNKIRADIVKRDADYRVSSVFAPPKLFRVLMPPPKNFLRSTKQFIQERWKMVLIALVALLGSFVAEFLGVDAAKIANQWIGNEMWARLLIAVVWVLRALAFTVFASFIYAKYFEKTK